MRDLRGEALFLLRARLGTVVQLTFYQPLYWLGLLLILGAGYALSLVDRPRPLKVGAFVCRAGAVVLLVIALCRPFVSRETRDLHVVFLIDVSESVDLEAVLEATPEIERAIEALSPGDSYTLGLLADGVRYLESLDELTGAVRQWHEGVADERFRRATRLHDGLLKGRLQFPSDKARRIVLFSDGKETQLPELESLALLEKEGQIGRAHV